MYIGHDFHCLGNTSNNWHVGLWEIKRHSTRQLTERRASLKNERQALPSPHLGKGGYPEHIKNSKINNRTENRANKWAKQFWEEVQVGTGEMVTLCCSDENTSTKAAYRGKHYWDLQSRTLEVHQNRKTRWGYRHSGWSRKLRNHIFNTKQSDLEFGHRYELSKPTSNAYVRQDCTC